MVFPQPMSRSEFGPDDSRVDDSRVDDSSPPDPTRILEQHLLAGFPPDLALDLVLNEVVVHAVEATHAVAGALALMRDGQMVCRAATGQLAPDLGIPLNAHDGLSGACLETRQPQLSVDTEFDPRVDPAVSRRLGIRSILIVPVFEGSAKNAQFAGLLEVFSMSPAAFSHNDQVLLEGFAAECARIRQAAGELSRRKPAVAAIPPELLPPDAAIPAVGVASPPQAIRPAYEAWTLALGGLAILTTVAVSFLMGTRIGWLRYAPPHAQTAPPVSPQPGEPGAAGNANSPSGKVSLGRTATKAREESPARAAKQAHSAPAAEPISDELVVYEKGKVIFRMKPAPAKADSPKQQAAKPNSVTSDSTTPDSNRIVKASSTTKLGTSASVWLSATQAEKLLLSRTEPLYPAEALAAHRAGNVVLEVQVAADGTVSSIRTLSGDPLLASAATEAVRNWRYQPYRRHDHAAQFQTDVTLTFNLPN
jgi:protein TonB